MLECAITHGNIVLPCTISYWNTTVKKAGCGTSLHPAVSLHLRAPMRSGGVTPGAERTGDLTHTHPLELTIGHKDIL